MNLTWQEKCSFKGDMKIKLRGRERMKAQLEMQHAENGTDLQGNKTYQAK